MHCVRRQTPTGRSHGVRPTTVPCSAWRSLRDGCSGYTPSEDFNGRLTRILLADLLQRLDMPALDPTLDPGPDSERYLQALQAADHADWWSLVTVWRERFEREAEA